MQDAGGNGSVRRPTKTITMDPDLIEAVEKARGYEPFSSFVNRKLREAMGLPTS